MKIFLIFILFAFLSACGGNDSFNDPLLKVYSDVQERTRGGALIASQSGVSSELKGAIDEELLRLFRDARTRNYQNDISPADYTIYVLPDCTLSPESGSRSFLIRADSYDGTEFDQDTRPGIGKIFAAELVITDGFGNLTNSYVVCNAPSADAEFRNAVRYGAEHIVLKRNDEAEYERTKFHGFGISSHPLIPSVPNTDKLLRRDVTGASGSVTVQ